MAINIIEPNSIALNDVIYQIEGRVRPQLLSRFPGRVSIGDNQFDNEQFLSSWIMGDHRGGIGCEEMDESVDADMCYWTDCIINYRNHLQLPRLATSISTSGTIASAASLTNTNFETAATGWTNGARSATQKHGGSYSWKVNNETAYQDAATWDNSWREKIFIVSCWVWSSSGGGSSTRIQINDGEGTSSSSYHTDGGSWELLTVTRTLDASAERLRVNLANSQGDDHFFDDLTIGSPATGTIIGFANFNGELYLALGQALLKLNAARDTFEVMGSFPAVITAIIPSLNSCLYIFMGDSENYHYMDTNELILPTNIVDANLGAQWSSKLIKLNSTGEGDYAATPNSATPTWSTTGDITDIGGDVQSLFLGKDANGDSALYAATKSILKILDFDNKKWLDTDASMCNHPNGGKGAIYWRGAHYISAGLDVTRYVSGSTPVISEVGLNRKDGLPVEYNGEIVKFGGDHKSDLFALVDASQTSGNSKSGLYAYDGRAWFCWWKDTSNNGAMHDVIVSSAESGYAVYWDVGGVVYYIDIHRGIRNPSHLSQKHMASGVFITPWTDNGTAVHDKLAKALESFCKNVDADETVVLKYRIDHADVTLDGGWNTIDTLNTSAENENREEDASGAGMVYHSIQYRLDLARGSTNTNTPDILGMVHSYKKLLGSKKPWGWAFTILAGGVGDWKPREIEAALKTAVETDLDIKFIFRSADSTETYFVQIDSFFAEVETGDNFEGKYHVFVVKA